MFKDIRLKLQACLTTANTGTVPVAWEGVNFTRPNPPAPWLAMQIIWGQRSRFSTVGASWVRRTGIVQLNVNVPSGSGATPAESLLDSLVGSCWKDQISVDSNTTITFFPGDALSAGDKDGYYTVIYSVPFQVDLPR